MAPLLRVSKLGKMYTNLWNPLIFLSVKGNSLYLSPFVRFQSHLSYLTAYCHLSYIVPELGFFVNNFKTCSSKVAISQTSVNFSFLRKPRCDFVSL